MSTPATQPRRPNTARPALCLATPRNGYTASNCCTLLALSSVVHDCDRAHDHPGDHHCPCGLWWCEVRL